MKVYKTSAERHEADLKSHRRAVERARLEVLAAYGNRCRTCGYDKIGALVLDHVRGNGAHERRQHRGRTIWRVVKKLGFPADYQVLCANCNMLKARDNHEFTPQRIAHA